MKTEKLALKYTSYICNQKTIGLPTILSTLRPMLCFKKEPCMMKSKLKSQERKNGGHLDQYGLSAVTTHSKSPEEVAFRYGEPLKGKGPWDWREEERLQQLMVDTMQQLQKEVTICTGAVSLYGRDSLHSENLFVASMMGFLNDEYVVAKH
jgi:hypothetical protein